MVQYQYPERGWSTGRMRKRGEKLAMMPDVDNYGILDQTRGKGLQGGGCRQFPAAQKTVRKDLEQVTTQGADVLSQLRDHLQGVQTGDITMGAFKKLLNKLGWTHDEKNNQFTDPEGNSHNAGPQ